MPLPSIKRYLPRSLLGRSLLILVTPLIVLQLVSAYVFYATHWDAVTRRLSFNLAGDISAVIELMRLYPGEENRGWIFAVARSSMDLQVQYEDGGILDDVRSAKLLGTTDDNLGTALADRLHRPFVYRVGGDSLAIDVQLGDGILHVLTVKKRIFSSTTYVFGLWMIGTSLLLFGIATIFMRNQVRSIRKLAAAADAFGKGREVTEFKQEGATEVRQAATAFQRMRDRIQRQIDQRTEMLAGVSHDLRTPLTRMKLQIAMMGDVEGRAELEEDIHDMERMLEGYLAFARGEGSEKPIDTDVSSLVEDVVMRCRREGADVALHGATQLNLPLRPISFSRCLANLIGNASRYGKTVAVTIGVHNEALQITVDDDGPGIPADKREQVFRPFYRLESSRNPKTGGIGLGLTIARDVVRAHGGDLLLEDSPLGGLRARLRLPI